MWLQKSTSYSRKREGWKKGVDSLRYEGSFSTLPKVLCITVSEQKRTEVQGDSSGQRLHFADFDLEVPPCCQTCHTMPILPDLLLLNQTKADIGTTKSKSAKCSLRPDGPLCTAHVGYNQRIKLFIFDRDNHAAVPSLLVVRDLARSPTISNGRGASATGS